MTILALHHAQLTIPKGAESEARALYCEFLGLTEIPKPDSLKGRGGFWMQLGPIQIHVGTEDGVERLKSKAHLAYAVSDLELWRARLSGRGIEILEGPPVPGHARFEFRDPFGNRAELIQRL